MTTSRFLKQVNSNICRKFSKILTIFESSACKSQCSRNVNQSDCWLKIRIRKRCWGHRLRIFQEGGNPQGQQSVPRCHQQMISLSNQSVEHSALLYFMERLKNIIISRLIDLKQLIRPPQLSVSTSQRPQSAQYRPAQALLRTYRLK